MAQPQPEKRSTRRFSLDLPITVKFPESSAGDVVGHTRDVSSLGVFFYIDSELAEGNSIDFVMTLPPEITLSDPVRVQCSGRVVRINQAGNEKGVAVAIEKYEFLHQT
jgi:PilZ domain